MLRVETQESDNVLVVKLEGRFKASHTATAAKAAQVVISL
jgi:hypothetical protein